MDNADLRRLAEQAIAAGRDRSYIVGPQAILALLDERDWLEAAADANRGLANSAMDRVAALEAIVRRFLSLEVRDTRRGSLPLRADSFAGIADAARALLRGKDEAPASGRRSG